MSVAKSWPVVEVVDPSTTRGLFCIWAVVDPDENWTVVQATVIPDDAFSLMAKGIQIQRGYLGHAPVKAILDCRGGGQIIDKETQETWFDRFHALGLHYELSVETPMSQLHEWLRPVWDPTKEKAVPKLRLTESVAAMKHGPAWAIERFIWTPDRKRATTAEYKQPGKDWVDCLRYLAGFPGLSYRKFRLMEAEPSPSLAESYAVPPLPARRQSYAERELIFNRPSRLPFEKRMPYRIGSRRFGRRDFS